MFVELDAILDDNIYLQGLCVFDKNEFSISYNKMKVINTTKNIIFTLKNIDFIITFEC